MLYMERPFSRTEEGLAVFSKYPILTSDHILLYRYIRFNLLVLILLYYTLGQFYMVHTLVWFAVTVIVVLFTCHVIYIYIN